VKWPFIKLPIGSHTCELALYVCSQWKSQLTPVANLYLSQSTYHILKVYNEAAKRGTQLSIIISGAVGQLGFGTMPNMKFQLRYSTNSKEVHCPRFICIRRFTLFKRNKLTLTSDNTSFCDIQTAVPVVLITFQAITSIT
jgi:hypothetical protein